MVITRKVQSGLKLIIRLFNGFCVIMFRWMPETGGANVPALNDLLSVFQIALGDRVFEGNFKLGDHEMYYASGTHIHTFPLQGVLVSTALKDQGKQVPKQCILNLSCSGSV